MAKKVSGDKANKIAVALIDGNSVKEEPSAEAVKALDEASKKKEIVSKDAKAGLIISTEDSPNTIDYDGGKIRLSGRGKERVDDISKLGNLPKGVKLKEL